MPRLTRKSTASPETSPAPAPESTPSAAEPGDDPSQGVAGPGSGVSETDPEPETPHPTNETRDPADTADPVDPVDPVDATPDPVVAVAEKLGPSVQSVIAAITCVDCPGAAITRPDVKLTGEQARLQLRVYQTLCDQGLTLRKQGDVYGWLLDQMLDHLAE